MYVYDKWHITEERFITKQVKPVITNNNYYYFMNYRINYRLKVKVTPKSSRPYFDVK